MADIDESNNSHHIYRILNERLHLHTHSSFPQFIMSHKAQNHGDRSSRIVTTKVYKNVPLHSAIENYSGLVRTGNPEAIATLIVCARCGRGLEWLIVGLVMHKDCTSTIIKNTKLFLWRWNTSISLMIRIALEWFHITREIDIVAGADLGGCLGCHPPKDSKAGA
jgi:hypothetical protein